MYLWLMLFFAFFFATAAVMVAVLRAMDSRGQAKLARALSEIRSGEPVVITSVRLETGPREKPEFERALEETPGLRAIVKALGKSYWDRKAGTILAIVAAMAAVGACLGIFLQAWLGAGAVPFAIVLCAALPILNFRRHAAKRMALLEEQLPDALDFLARSVRTGNAFSVSMEMLVRETDEPLKAEFLRVTREQALGASLETAMKHMLRRIPLIEVRFFVAAILLQRETGGNLAEVLNKLSVSVRDRLRMKAQVRASSAQARLTARILSVLPLAVIAMMNVISPAYFRAMTNDPIGRTMLLAAVVAQLIGYYCMRSITNVEV